jgi:hypothetical protein
MKPVRHSPIKATTVMTSLETATEVMECPSCSVTWSLNWTNQGYIYKVVQFADKIVILGDVMVTVLAIGPKVCRFKHSQE